MTIPIECTEYTRLFLPLVLFYHSSSGKKVVYSVHSIGIKCPLAGVSLLHTHTHIYIYMCVCVRRVSMKSGHIGHK